LFLPYKLHTAAFIKKSILLIIVCLTVCAYSCFQQSLTGNQNVITVPVNASTVANALLYLPQNYQQSVKRFPLIIYLHGIGQAGTDIKSMLGDGLPKAIAKGLKPEAMRDGKIYQFIVFSPQAREWSYQEKELKFMLPYLIKKYRIDTSRIYVTGISAGGFGAYTCVATEDSSFAKKIAAVVAVSPVALDFSKDEQFKTGIKKYGTPVLDICGTADAMIANARRYDTLVNNSNSPAKYKLIEIKNGTHTVADTAYNINSTFGDFGMNIYQWMLQFSRNADTNKSAQIAAEHCGGKRIYVTRSADGGVYINGNSFSYNAGDTIVLRASQNPFSYFALDFFNKGTTNCPVVIINEGGKVQLTTGFSFTGCKHIKITGSGSADKYGFKISQDGLGVGISVQGRSSNIEIDHLEIYKKTYGVWVKHEADCADSLQFPNWVLHDISIHDNYIHNMHQEGMYLGSTDPNGLRTVECNGKTISPKPMRLGNIHVYNNIIDSTTRGGIQLCDADSGYNEINNNTVTNCGFEFNTSQGNGIVLGGYAHADIHDNYVRATYTAGIFSLGAGLIKIYSNEVDSSGYLGGKKVNGMSNIMIDTRPTNVPSPGQPNPVLAKFIIQNNSLGINTDFNIRVYKSVDTYKTGNIICNNNGNIKVEAGINWSKDCGDLQKSNQ
jgi:poly(3-hydroxybutyrate) depolymerase